MTDLWNWKQLFPGKRDSCLPLKFRPRPAVSQSRSRADHSCGSLLTIADHSPGNQPQQYLTWGSSLSSHLCEPREPPVPAAREGWGRPAPDSPSSRELQPQQSTSGCTEGKGSSSAILTSQPDSGTSNSRALLLLQDSLCACSAAPSSSNPTSVTEGFHLS